MASASEIAKRSESEQKSYCEGIEDGQILCTVAMERVLRRIVISVPLTTDILRRFREEADSERHSLLSVIDAAGRKEEGSCKR